MYESITSGEQVCKVEAMKAYREVGVWTQAMIVQRHMREDAKDFLNYFAVQYEDTPAVDAWIAGRVTDVPS